MYPVVPPEADHFYEKALIWTEGQSKYWQQTGGLWGQVQAAGIPATIRDIPQSSIWALKSQQVSFCWVVV